MEDLEAKLAIAEAKRDRLQTIHDHVKGMLKADPDSLHCHGDLADAKRDLQSAQDELALIHQRLLGAETFFRSLACLGTPTGTAGRTEPVTPPSTLRLLARGLDGSGRFTHFKLQPDRRAANQYRRSSIAKDVQYSTSWVPGNCRPHFSSRYLL